MVLRYSQEAIGKVSTLSIQELQQLIREKRPKLLALVANDCFPDIRSEWQVAWLENELNFTRRAEQEFRSRYLLTAFYQAFCTGQRLEKRQVTALVLAHVNAQLND